MKTPDPDILVVLTSVRTEFEGQTIVASLEAEGIPARVFAAGANMLQWEGGYTNPIKVMVRRADLERAAELLRDKRKASVDIDWSEIDVGDREDGEPTIAAYGKAYRGRPGWVPRVRRVGTILVVAIFLSWFVQDYTFTVVVAFAALASIVLWDPKPRGARPLPKPSTATRIPEDKPRQF